MPPGEIKQTNKQTHKQTNMNSRACVVSDQLWGKCKI